MLQIFERPLSPDWALPCFGLHGYAVEPASAKPDRAVWRVSRGPEVFALKAVRLSASRVAFVTAVHAYLSARCDLVPELLRAKTGDLFVDDGETRYLAMAWAPGRPPDLASADDLALVGEALARFHQATRGFASGAGGSRSILRTWLPVYQRSIDDLLQCRNLARARRGLVAQTLVGSLATVMAQAQDAVAQLARSPYGQWCDEVTSSGQLCHQDFAHGNLVIGPDGVKVYDLDTVIADLPARDLRKLVNRVFIRARIWTLPHLRAVLAGYRRRLVLSQGHLRILAADLAFPHLVYRVARAYFQGIGGPRPEAYWARAFERALIVELSKPPILDAFRTEEGLT